MQDANSEIMKALETRLQALVRCVLKKAQADPDFAGQLEEILLSDSLRTSLRSKESAAPASRSVFDPVGYLQDHGQDRLRRELRERPNSELMDVVRFYRIVKGKAAKGLDRATMVEQILAYAERSLKQGGAFLRDSKGRSEGEEKPIESVAGHGKGNEDRRGREPGNRQGEQPPLAVQDQAIPSDD